MKHPSRMDVALAKVARGVTSDQIQAAKQFVLSAKALGIAVTVPEAFDHLSKGGTFAGETMLRVEMVPESSAVTAPFFAQRALRIANAFEKALDLIAPAAADLREIGLRSQRAAFAAMTAMEVEANAGARRLLAAAANTVVPDESFVVVDTPAFRFSLNRIRADQSAAPFAIGASNSIGAIDAVTRDMSALSKVRRNLGRGDGLSEYLYRQDAEILDREISMSREIAGRVDPGYALALTTEKLAEETILAPMRISAIAKIAATTDPHIQARAIFPIFAAEGLANGTERNVRMMEDQIPGSAAALVRIFLSNQFAESTRSIAVGAGAWAGAQFAADAIGNHLKELNLRAALAALPNGAMVAPRFAQLFEILRATGTRRAAKELLALNDLDDSDLAVEAPNPSFVGAFRARTARAIMKAYARWQIGCNAYEFAKVLLCKNPARDFEMINKARIAFQIAKARRYTHTAK